MGVSIFSPSSLYRLAHRGGGFNGGDWISIWRSAVNCSSVCTNCMLPGGLQYAAYPNTQGFDPYYLKCFDARSSAPMNTRRLQLPSQEQTAQLDPNLPQIIPITNVSACLRMLIFRGEFINMDRTGYL